MWPLAFRRVLGGERAGKQVNVALGVNRNGRLAMMLDGQGSAAACKGPGPGDGVRLPLQRSHSLWLTSSSSSSTHPLCPAAALLSAPRLVLEDFDSWFCEVGGGRRGRIRANQPCQLRHTLDLVTLQVGCGDGRCGAGLLLCMPGGMQGNAMQC